MGKLTMAWHSFRWIQEYRPGMDAEHLMRRYGIPVANRRIPSSRRPGVEVGFDVPRHQAVWAEYILCRAGWVLVTPLLDKRHAAILERARTDGASRPIGGGKIKRQGIVAKFYGLMDNMFLMGESYRESWQPPQTQWRSTSATHHPRPRPTLWRRILVSLTGFKSIY